MASATEMFRHRQHVLALYRAFMREAMLMPTVNRQQYIKAKARHEFRQNKDLTGLECEFAIQLADTQLDNVVRQRKLLNDLAKEGNLKGPR